MIQPRFLHASYTSSPYNLACLTVIIRSYSHDVHISLRLRISSQHGQGFALSVPHCSLPLCIVSKPLHIPCIICIMLSRLICIAIPYPICLSFLS